MGHDPRLFRHRCNPDAGRRRAGRRSIPRDENIHAAPHPWGDPDLQGSGPGSRRWACRCSARAVRDAERAHRRRVRAARRRRSRQEETSLAEIDVFTADTANAAPSAVRRRRRRTGRRRGKPSRQASLIVDPPDGRQPPLSEEGQKRAGASRPTRQPAATGCRAAKPTRTSIAASMTAASRAACSDRSCRSSTTTATRSCRRPGFVAIRNEMIHEARIVPLDGRPHLPPHQGLHGRLARVVGRQHAGRRDDEPQWHERRRRQRRRPQTAIASS